MDAVCRIREIDVADYYRTGSEHGGDGGSVAGGECQVGDACVEAGGGVVYLVWADDAEVKSGCVKNCPQGVFKGGW